jgi:uncharacterized membrane protein
MTKIREWITVDATPEEVWRVVSAPRNLPKWNFYIHSVHDVPENGLKPGAKYWTKMAVLGVQLRVDSTIEEFDPPHYARVHLRGPLEAVVRTWVRPAGRRRSRLEHEVDYKLKGGPIGALVARGLRLFGASTVLKRGLRSQRRQVEGR